MRCAAAAAGSTAGGSGSRRSHGGAGGARFEVGDDRPTEREGVLVVERLMVGDTGKARMDLGAAEVLGRDVLAGGRLHEGRAAKEDRAGALGR